MTRSRATWCVSAALLALAAPATALGHGEIPAMLAVAMEDPADGPQVLRLTVGLAAREAGAERWHWLCPALWGGPPSPLTGGTPESGTILGGGSDALRLVDTALTPLATPELMSTRVRDLAVDRGGGTVWILAASSDSPTALWRVEGGVPRRVLSLADSWHDMTVHGDRLVLVRPDDIGAIVLGTIAVDSPQAPALSYPTGLALGAPGVRSDGEALYVTLRVGSDHELYRIDEATWEATRVHRVDDASIDGPVRQPDGAILITAGGALLRLGADGTSAVVDDTRTWTCLGERLSGPAGSAWGCTRESLFAVDALGAVTEVVTLGGLAAPSTEGLSFADGLRCEAEWLDFRADAGLFEPQVPADGAVETDEDVGVGSDAAQEAGVGASVERGCGCTALGAAEEGRAALVVLGLLMGLLAVGARGAKGASRGS